MPSSRANSRSLTVEELFEQYAKRSYHSWLQPKSGDLLGDARYFLIRARRSTDRANKARYARGSVVMSVATIEAITNDALTAISSLLMDTWPSECVDDLPWRYFCRFSTRPIKRLVKQGTLPRKVKYVLRHVERLTPDLIDDDLDVQLKKAIQARNRIVHMTFLLNPNKYPSVLNDRQVIHTAESAYKTAKDYIDTLGGAFDEVNLPIETIRPEWYFEETWPG